MCDIAFPRQRWLRERSAMLRYTCIASLVKFITGVNSASLRAVGCVLAKVVFDYFRSVVYSNFIVLEFPFPRGFLDQYLVFFILYVQSALTTLMWHKSFLCGVCFGGTGFEYRFGRVFLHVLLLRQCHISISSWSPLISSSLHGTCIVSVLT